MSEQFRKLTPILYVEAIEPVLGFWTDRLGFTLTTEVPEGDRLGFVILARDGIELMMQTRASVAADLPAVGETPMRGTILFLEVADLDAIEKALAGIEQVVPRRRTFYGSEEIWVREPAGNLVGFAFFGGTGE
jgi:uncharacterized glyoxalase superfamily protein PhnB